MKKFEGFQAGVNLGGWISQYRVASKEHFDSFITEADIAQIASWGMDHVRLPVDYMVLEDDDSPFEYKEEGFFYVDQCIDWCEKHNLNIILDLHRAPGYSFNALKENRLFEDEHLQERFIRLWQEIAKRYKSYDSSKLVFELLNEIVEANSDRWNSLSKRAVIGIREIDNDRTIIIGGNHYNSVNTLKEMDKIVDDNLVYTFHFYEPHIFTHQKASWEVLRDLDFEVTYPSGEEVYEKYMELDDEIRKKYALNRTMDKDFLRDYLKPALDFAKERNVPLYCGEYGVIDHAPMDSNLRWHEDLCELLREYGIGRAVWTYKLMSFPMVDKDSVVRNKALIEIVSKK